MREDGLLTVEGLIVILQQFHPESVVIVASDSEGNEFSPLSEVTAAFYQSIHPWRGRIGLGELTEELKSLGYSEDDVIEGIPCIILDPML